MTRALWRCYRKIASCQTGAGRLAPDARRGFFQDFRMVHISWQSRPKLRRNAETRHIWMNPHHLHPLFTEGDGAPALSNCRRPCNFWSSTTGAATVAEAGPHRTLRAGTWRCPKTWAALLAQKWLKDRKVILHTDSTKSYRIRVPGRCVTVSFTARNGWKSVVPGNGCNPATSSLWNTSFRAPRKSWKWRQAPRSLIGADRISINQNAKIGSYALRAKLRSARYQCHRQTQRYYEPVFRAFM